MASGYVHGQFETSPQNEVATSTLSTKVIYFPATTVKTDLAPDHLNRDDEMRGTAEPVPLVAEKYDPTIEVESRAYPDVTGFLLKAILGAPTTTTGNGVITDPDSVAIPTGAFKHVWTSPFYAS